MGAPRTAAAAPDLTLGLRLEPLSAPRLSDAVSYANPR